MTIRTIPILTLALLLVSAGAAPALEPEPTELARCLKLALERNPGLKAAEQRIDVARHGERAAGAAMLPSITLQDTYDKTVRSFNPLFTYPDTSHVATAELRQPVYSGGKLQAAERGARRQVERALWELAEARNAVVEGVVRAYLDWLQQDEVNEYFRSAIERDQKLVTEIGVRVDAGKALEADRLQAHIRVLDDQRKLLEGTNRAELARSILLTHMDLPQGTPLSPVKDLALLQAIAEPAPVLGESNPALRAASSSVEAARADLAKTRGESRPTVDVAVRQSHALDGLGFLSIDPNFTDYIAVMSFPLFDSGLRRARTKAAKATVEAAREEYRNLRLQKELELTRARLELSEASNRLAIAQDKKKSAAENLRVAKERYDAGTVLLSETLDAAASVEFAATEEITARFDVYRAKVSMLRLQGRMAEAGLLQAGR